MSPGLRPDESRTDVSWDRGTDDCLTKPDEYELNEKFFRTGICHWLFILPKEPYNAVENMKSGMK